jgi:hypothetical protein
MAASVVIRPVGSDERAAWEPLWNGYLAFYEATLAPGATSAGKGSAIPTSRYSCWGPTSMAN